MIRDHLALVFDKRTPDYPRIFQDGASPPELNDVDINPNWTGTATYPPMSLGISGGITTQNDNIQVIC
jgi:hypothetical protein